MGLSEKNNNAAEVLEYILQNACNQSSKFAAFFKFTESLSWNSSFFIFESSNFTEFMMRSSSSYRI